MLPGAVSKQALKCGPDCRFVPYAQFLELAQRRVVVLNRFVRRLEFQRLHPRFFPCECDAVEVSAVKQAMASNSGSRDPKTGIP